MNEEMNNADFNNKVEIITRQTDYSIEEAREKLIECNNDYQKVIKLFLGIVEKKESPIVSINQEIYKQLRHRMNSSMKEYELKTQTKT